MNRNVFSILSVLLVGQPIVAHADQATPRWQGEAELGFVRTDGNTESQSVIAKAKVNHNREVWTHTGILDIFSSSDAVRTTAERYFLSAKSDYAIEQNRYLFATTSFEDDRFSGYDYRIAAAVGYGMRVVNRPNLKVDVEAGPGARKSKLVSGGTQEEFIGRLSGQLRWKINDQAGITQDIVSEVGEEATVSKSVSALKAQVAGKLAMKLTFTARHTTKPPAGLKETDTETAATLVYSF